MQGDRGKAGPEGLPGAAGTQGTEGPVGLTGNPGKTGENVSLSGQSVADQEGLKNQKVKSFILVTCLRAVFRGSKALPDP